MNEHRILQSLILGNPACASFIESGDDASIAQLLSVGRVTVVKTEIGIGTVLATLGEYGGAFLDGLTALGEVDRNIHWSLDIVKQGVFDVGMEGTRAQMQQLAKAKPELAPMFNKLLALAEVPNPYTPEQVSIALRGPWGDVPNLPIETENISENKS